MNESDDKSVRRTLLILHRGFVEIRLLIGAKQYEQAHDLADTLELVPGILNKWNSESLQQVRELLTSYQAKYPNASFDFVSRLNDQEPLPF